MEQEISREYREALWRDGKTKKIIFKQMILISIFMIFYLKTDRFEGVLDRKRGVDPEYALDILQRSRKLFPLCHSM